MTPISQPNTQHELSNADLYPGGKPATFGITAKQHALICFLQMNVTNENIDTREKRDERASAAG